ncbi:MAG: hypothetical protein J7K12_01590, partial [Thermoplasmata archaeon]|nr:hypothetical protein [Thermoplasmata archaeon]
RGWGRGRGFGATLGYCPWTGLPRGWRWFMPYYTPYYTPYNAYYGYPYHPAYYSWYRYPWW